MSCSSSLNAATPPRGPVVLELFTSQGCSSCPPADAFLSELTTEPNVITLAFHVDYWDSLGWKDPFSQGNFSERQRLYGEAFRRDGIYTPQLVLNGRSEAVGSDRSRIRSLLGQVEPASTPITLEARREGQSLSITAAGPAGAGQLLVVITESGLSTDVRRGENAGRHLDAAQAVRRLDPLPASGKLVLPLDPSWNPAHLTVVVLLQDPATLKIQGVATSKV